MQLDLRVLTKYPNPTGQPWADKPLMACSFTPSILQISHVHLPLWPAAHPASTRYSGSAARSPQSLWKTQNCYPAPGTYMHFSGTMARDANLSEEIPNHWVLDSWVFVKCSERIFCSSISEDRLMIPIRRVEWVLSPPVDGQGDTHCPWGRHLPTSTEWVMKLWPLRMNTQRPWKHRACKTAARITAA